MSVRLLPSSAGIQRAARPEKWKADSRAVASRRCFIALVALYFVIYGGILGISRGMPYVLDNGESFETLGQAQNIHRFGFNTTFGITDASNGPDPAQHPYVYTHEGNLPRFWAVLLYALGIRSIEPQIVITTFTIGLGGLWLMYTYFSRVVSPIFALISGAIFNTDYLLFTQWQVNVFRVWHTTFLFACVLSAHFAASRFKAWSLLAIGLYAGLFYFETSFAIFTTVLCALYVVLVHRNWRTWLFLWSRQLVGTVIAVGTMVSQLIAYYGLTGLRQDFYLTFLMRNHAAADPALSRELDTFLGQHHVAFWGNMGDAGTALTFPGVVLDFYRYTIGLIPASFASLGVAVQGIVSLALLGTAALGISGLGLGPNIWGVAGIRCMGGYLLAGAAAYVLTLLVLPGYVVSTNLFRYTPMAVFVLDVAIALILYGLLARMSLAWLEWRQHGALKLPAMANPLLFVGFLALWLWAQIGYVSGFPPTLMNGLERLRRAPYRGASFVVNYAPHFAASFTGQWAYFDPVIGYRPMKLTPNGVQLQHGLFYLWLADKGTNAAYLRPDYFMCFYPPSPDKLAALGESASRDCSETLLIESTLMTLPPAQRESLVYIDPSGRNTWAIVDLRQLQAYLWSVRLPEAMHFTNGMDLVGLERPARQVSPGDVVHLALVWQAAHHIDFDYSAFVRLRDDRGRVIHGEDHEPGMQYKLPLPNWSEGLLVRDDWETTIPDDATPGEYRLEIGIYNYQNMESVKSVAGNDAASLDVVTVTAR